MKTFREELIEQRWDDHRFYHHSLINQSLHFVSANTFLLCYALLLVVAFVATEQGGDYQSGKQAVSVFHGHGQCLVFGLV